jgi:DNA polymerase-1
VIIDSLTDLPNLHTEDEVILAFMEYKRVAKRASAFGEKFLTTKVTHRVPIITTDTVKNGRIHATYTQIINTGRMSCSKPNMQQIPSDTIEVEGVKIAPYRECFGTAEGFKFCTADYGGQELGILAASSGEESWIETLRDGGDLHMKAASLLYGSKWEDMTDAERKEGRSKAKTINFGNAYGLSYKSFSTSMGVSAFEAKKTFADYANAFPKLDSMLRRKGQEAVATFECRSLPPFNRLRTLKGLEEYRRRNIGKNMSAQGSAADMTKLGICKIDSEIEKRNWGRLAYLVGAVHDELIYEVHESIIDQFTPIQRRCMEDAAEYILKMRIVKAPVVVSEFWKH